jgi:hypothetical protein
MGKKCIPGVFCIENMTLFLLFFITVVVTYLWYVHFIKYSGGSAEPSKIVIITAPNQSPLATISTRNDPINDPYSPPMKTDGLIYPTNSSDVRGVPVNMQSRGLPTGYQQVGILTRSTNGPNEMILPLMGRRSMSGRDKWQYYTMSNTGNLNTKLPVSLNGKSCTSEYGCDNINNGDVIYVEGYNDTFRVTMYENNLFQYIPGV